MLGLCVLEFSCLPEMALWLKTEHHSLFCLSPIKDSDKWKKLPPWRRCSQEKEVAKCHLSQDGWQGLQHLAHTGSLRRALSQAPSVLKTQPPTLVSALACCHQNELSQKKIFLWLPPGPCGLWHWSLNLLMHQRHLDTTLSQASKTESSGIDRTQKGNLYLYSMFSM